MTGPARWTVETDEDDTGLDALVCGSEVIVSDRAPIMVPASYAMPHREHAALVADVRAARAHDTCHHTHDTLRHALADIMRQARLMHTGRTDHEQLVYIGDMAARALLTAEGPDQTDGGTDG